MNASVAERTDRIINYSGALNSSEEAIEAAVNASGNSLIVNNVSRSHSQRKGDHADEVSNSYAASPPQIHSS